MIRGVVEKETHNDRLLYNKLLVQSSGKFMLLSKLLPSLQSEGHQVLIFSQFINTLNLLEDLLALLGFTFDRLDGSVRGDLRQQKIDRFNAGKAFAFLLSTKAGGLGLNLTAADTVIIFDNDWNPQNDSQATARCHRIGQKQEVSVYRLLTRHTYEYEMFERASRKLAIETVVLNHEKMLRNQGKEEDKKESGMEGEAAKDETPVVKDETPSFKEEVSPPKEGSISETPTNNETPLDDRESTTTHKTETNQLEDLPDGESSESESDETKKNSDEDYMEEEESVATKNTEEPSVVTEKTEEPSVVTEKTERTMDYGIPAMPVIPMKKKRGRKPTKKRTIEDELNPLKRSKNEVEEMLKRGLFDCLMNNDDANGIDFFEADIDTILKKNLKSVGSLGRDDG